MKVATTTAELDRFRASIAGGCVFVPTMGALHAGHTSLIGFAAQMLRREPGLGGCIVSIFVNPTQFDEQADFARYPRTMEQDLKLCEEAGAGCVYAPTVDEVYPPGLARPPSVLPRVATAPGLEDAVRPGHFAGVYQVVRRLFELVAPQTAVFGEKDWQQLQVIRAMVRMEGMAVEVVGAPTVREKDGLAMSSRNRFLAAADRARGLALSRALCEANSCATAAQAEAVMAVELKKAGVTPDYAVVRDAATLEVLPSADPSGWRALIAARIGSVRLIDNAPWAPRG